MNNRFGLVQKLLLCFLLMVAAIIGFMVKLPSGFRHIDKELHALFYFLGAAVLNILFVKRKLAGHVLVFVALYAFGLAIEYAQAYSNQYFHRRIHGRFDPEDVQANLKGLVAFSVVWMIYALGVLLFRREAPKKTLSDGYFRE